MSCGLCGGNTHTAHIFWSDWSSSGVEQQRGEGRVYGPGCVVRVGEGLLWPSEASAAEAGTADGWWDARTHRPEDRHCYSADRHLTSAVTRERAECFAEMCGEHLVKLPWRVTSSKCQHRESFDLFTSAGCACVWAEMYTDRSLVNYLQSWEVDRLNVNFCYFTPNV